MSQRSEKLIRRVERLEGSVGFLEKIIEVRREESAALARERDAERRRAREAERAFQGWKTLTYAALVTAILVLLLAIHVRDGAGEVSGEMAAGRQAAATDIFNREDMEDAYGKI